MQLCAAPYWDRDNAAITLTSADDYGLTRTVITPPRKRPGTTDRLYHYIRSTRHTHPMLHDHVLDCINLTCSIFFQEKSLSMMLMQGSAAEAAIGDANKDTKSLMTTW